MRSETWSGRGSTFLSLGWGTRNISTIIRLPLMPMLCLRKMEEKGFINLDLGMITAAWRTTSASGEKISGRP